MRYKGYTILASYQITRYHEVDEDGVIGDVISELDYADPRNDYWFTVQGKDRYPLNSFESVQECKDYIDEELTDATELEH